MTKYSASQKKQTHEHDAQNSKIHARQGNNLYSRPAIQLQQANFHGNEKWEANLTYRFTFDLIKKNMDGDRRYLSPHAFRAFFMQFLSEFDSKLVEDLHESNNQIRPYAISGMPYP
ncbi:MAG: hypothetical protein ACTSSI_14435 [Candidatus Helarchaeota archaeon]